MERSLRMFWGSAKTWIGSLDAIYAKLEFVRVKVRVEQVFGSVAVLRFRAYTIKLDFV